MRFPRSEVLAPGDPGDPTPTGGTAPSPGSPGLGNPERYCQRLTVTSIFRSVARVPLIQCKSHVSGSFSPMNSVCEEPSLTSSYRTRLFKKNTPLSLTSIGASES